MLSVGPPLWQSILTRRLLHLVWRLSCFIFSRKLDALPGVEVLSPEQRRALVAPLVDALFDAALDASPELDRELRSPAERLAQLEVAARRAARGATTRTFRRFSTLRRRRREAHSRTLFFLSLSLPRQDRAAAIPERAAALQRQTRRRAAALRSERRALRASASAVRREISPPELALYYARRLLAARARIAVLLAAAAAVVGVVAAAPLSGVSAADVGGRVLGATRDLGAAGVAQLVALRERMLSLVAAVVALVPRA